ncbi:molecular chaperone Hsp33 [Geothermobacter ehrlichii]|uniref:33 kDa chaperonin n=1 Tax=Geothermobacter ehrlichii TaxID=213224 RepID=A0A5D3WL00_9BACT|nr:Hsp33 family molecular chaperone HslO [Geothermobacter ehrlichii]TYO98160.1 molecular chaperone Hsp33 [Geothermobacter ehrlichii]
MSNNDYLIRVLSDDGTLRATAALTTRLVADLQQRHGTDPVATIALGRLATGAALLGAQLKGKQRLALMVESNGPLQRLQAETDADGAIRATIRQPLSGPPPEDGRSAVAQAVGRAGFLHVIRDLGMKEPYHSTVQLQTSEIGEDLAYYLTSSEQVPSAVSLAVRLNENAEVTAAGGFLIQALPGCPDDRLQQLEQTIAALPPLSELLVEGKTPEQVLQLVLAGIDHHQVGRYQLRFECRCNLRRIVEMLRALPAEERRELAGREEATTVTCEYCRKSYSFTPDELAGLGS